MQVASSDRICALWKYHLERPTIIEIRTLKREKSQQKNQD